MLCGLLLACGIVVTAAFIRHLWGSDGYTDRLGRLLGADFSAIWGAGKAALAGDYVSAYGLDWFKAHLLAVFADRALVLAWSYPPVLYALAAPLAALPYSAALLVWLGGAYAALALVARRIIGHPLAWAAALAFPGFYGNALQGQSGFLIAAIFGGALLALRRRPALAGLLLALLVLKPQFGLLVPIALIAARQWKALGFAIGFGSIIVAASAMAFGIESWQAFIAGLDEARANALDRGAMGYYILQSLFGVLRQFGVPLPLAYLAQGALALAAAFAIWRLWRSPSDDRLKYAGLITASLLISPYCMDYDLVLLAPAIAFLVSHGLARGFGPWGQTALALAFVVAPLARFSTFFLRFPLGLFAVTLLFTILLWRASRPDTNTTRVAETFSASAG